MDGETKPYNGLMHAGAGTGLFLVQLWAIIPGFLPTLALLGMITALVLLPLLALALVGVVLAAPPVGVWLLVRIARARRGAQRLQPAAAPLHP